MMLFCLHLIILDREENEKNPGNFPTSIQWKYEPTTGTSGLRKHIKNTHLELYKQLCTEHNIKPSETIVGKSPEEAPPTLPTTREPFTKESLLRHIRNFVVADDQVSFKLHSTSIITDHFSLSMSSSAQSFGNCCLFYERIFMNLIFLDVTNSDDLLWRPFVIII